MRSPENRAGVPPDPQRYRTDWLPSERGVGRPLLPVPVPVPVPVALPVRFPVALPLPAPLPLLL